MIRKWLRWQPNGDRELDEELRSHLQMAIQDRIARGEHRLEAERSARREFGNELLVRETTRDVWVWEARERLVQDLKLALRQCRRRPAYSAAIVSTIAIAAGANIAVFSVMNAVLLRALPFAAPQQLVWIASVRPDNPEAPFTLPEFLDYQRRTHTVSVIAAYANWSASIFLNGTTERLQGARMSGNSFEVLGVSPAAGRLLNESDDRADAPRVALVSHRLWQQYFGGAADTVGKNVRINGESVVLVGVLPPHFPVPLLRGVDVVIPLAPDRDPLRYERRSVNFLRLFGRLAPGTTAYQAQLELTSICRSLRQQFPVEYARKDAVRAIALNEVFVGDFRRSVLLLFGAVLIVLGAALANLVALVMVRANERRPELSVRIAIGASRGQLARQLTMEALLLTLIGGGLGLLFAVWATFAALPTAPAAIPRLAETSIDGTVLLFAAAIVAGAAMVLSIAPLGSVIQTRAGDVLRLAGRGAVGDMWNRRLRQALVAGEIAIALSLVLTTTVLMQSLLRLQHVQAGFRPDAVFQARVSIPPAYRTPDDLTHFYERLGERLTRLPGVQNVGLINVAPLSGILSTVPFTIEGQPPARERDIRSANLRAISPGYLSAAGTRVINGRSILEQDRANTPLVALVSSALAERFLADSALGHHLLIDDNNQEPRPVEIVGVVENVRQTTLDAPPSFDIYIPLPQIHPEIAPLLRNNQFWMIRTNTDPDSLRVAFLKNLKTVDPDAAIADAGSMREYLEESLAPRRFNLTLFSVFSLTAVLLAVSGLYGLMSYSVSQRSREIGLRMAIGASAGDVRGLVLREAARLGSAGTVAGLFLAAIARPFASRITPDLAVDPIMVAAVTGLLIAVVMLAAWLPARRAAAIDPVPALRGE